MKKNSGFWILGGLAGAAIVLILVSNFLNASPVSNEVAAPIALSADDHKKGAENSQVILIEYLDFECEACGAYYPLVKKMEAEFGDRITFVARYFPLQGHRNGVPAAHAVEAASRQGKFWEMHDILYERQKDWGEKQVATPEVFEAYAQELGLDMDKFKADVGSPDVAARVKRDMDEGIQLGVKSTPTFFLNGNKLANPQSEEAFRSILQNALQ
ncbi:MAG: Periplasmic thiol:disulfide interchange protein DsbA [Parcubacteria bacterium C7867-008]|nr:MAG: Periplasmic thiol:disulfide interchange protein DsbA [Parcubacteria bacterium C7867-008]